jgi:MrcB-like, N-terminal domain
MALRDTLEAVLREYDSAKLTTFVGNPLAEFIRKEAVLDLERAAGPAAVGLLFAGSAGAENWAEVPWLAAFDPVVTDSVSPAATTSSTSSTFRNRLFTSH